MMLIGFAGLGFLGYRTSRTAAAHIRRYSPPGHNCVRAPEFSSQLSLPCPASSSANKPDLQFNGHETGDGELILKHAGKLGVEGP
jgi:hypothetical protein